MIKFKYKLYITTMLCILIGIPLWVIDQSIAERFLVYYFPFGLISHQVLNIIAGSLAILIFIVSNNYFSKNKNAHIAILAGGFLAGAIIYFQGLLEQSEVLSNLLFGYGPEFNHFFSLLTYGLCIFLSVSSIQTQKIVDNNFRNKVYTYFIIYAVLISIADRVLSYYFLDYIYKIIPNLVLIKTTIINLYFLAACIYTDITLTNKQKHLSPFNYGLFWLGLIPLFFILSYGTVLYAISIPVVRIIGFSLLLLGLKEFNIKPDFLNLRQKFAIHMSIFLVITFVLFVPTLSLVTDVKIPPHFSFLLYGFFLLTILFQYIISEKFTKPLKDITNSLKAFEPDVQPRPILEKTNDEIQILTSSLNQYAQTSWEYQQKLKEQAKREKLIKTITENIRSSLDLEETLNLICIEAAKLLKVQRSAISTFYNSIGEEEFTLRKEYKTTPYIKGFEYHTELKSTVDYWKDNVLKTKQILALNNVEESNVPEYFKKAYTEMGVKSLIGIGIGDRDNTWGTIALAEYNTYRTWSEEDKNLLRTIADQIYISIKQSELFEVAKQTAETEKFNRKILELLRDTLDKETTIHLFIRNVGQYFKADRVFFSEFDEASKKFLPYNNSAEYLSSIDEKSYTGFDWSIGEISEYINPLLSKREVNILCWDEYILANPKGEGFVKRFTESNVKSSYSLPVVYEGKIKGFFCIEFTKSECKKLNENDITRIRSLCSQTGIALHNIEVNENSIKVSNEKEVIIKQMQSTAEELLNNTLRLREEMLHTPNTCDQHLKYLNEINKIVNEILTFIAKTKETK